MTTPRTPRDRTDAPVPAPRRPERGERWTDRLGWEEGPAPSEHLSRG
ncbi:hypothetical protein [Pseudonocardia spirodelae]|uniref:Uncharacterized protein n=1 Tax=Pseudonocardia spirodelae TaxID=3133431 RepID=A0ABU8T4K7_9PSEU